jgi:hypothetical protein
MKHLGYWKRMTHVFLNQEQPFDGYWFRHCSLAPKPAGGGQGAATSKARRRIPAILLATALLLAPSYSAQARPPGDQWRTMTTNGAPVARHECGFVESGGKFYLIGGRGEKPVDVYDPASNAWSQGAAPPLEIHHFQPVSYQGRIYVAGALTGKFPVEAPVPYILIYDPASDTWTKGPEIPEARRRGAAGAVVRGDKLYLICGIVNGHTGSYVNWFDELDLRSGRWTELPDAPRTRDHFQAASIGDELYAAGGRTSSYETQETGSLTIGQVDVFNFASGKWTILSRELPTRRAGTFTVALGDRLIVLGGESAVQREAHAEVEAFRTSTGLWEKLPPLAQGRHGTGVILYQGQIYTAAGNGTFGGGNELTSLESLKLGNAAQ